MSAVPSLETIFADRRFFGVESATPVQRAICRICEGLPLGELASCDDVREAVGGEEALAILTPGGFRPREVDILAAIRSGKSRFVAAHAFWSSQIVVAAAHLAGETVRYPILSVNLTSAISTFDQIAGTMMARPLLKALLVGEPSDGTIRIRHPSGRIVEVRVAAGARAGANLVSVWLAGCAFEEYPRQASEAQGAVVNFEQQLQAAAGRVVDGGQLISCGSPWAPTGAAYERFATGFGRPNADRVIIKAPGPAMNPVWWTPARCEALKRSNPSAYITDVLAGFADPSSSHITQSEVKAATRAEPMVLAPQVGRWYLAAMDPATRGNAWTLVVVAYYTDADGVTRYEVARAEQWIGSSISPLSPHATLAEIAKLIAPYNLKEVQSDQHAGDHNVEIAARFGLRVRIHTITPGNAPAAETGKPAPPGRAYRSDLYETMKGAFASGVISIPNDRVLINDLLSIRRRLTAASVTYDLPESSDGRHCDYAPALALCLSQFPTAGALRAVQADAEHSRVLRYFASGIFGPSADHAHLSPEQLAMLSSGAPEEYALDPVGYAIAHRGPIVEKAMREMAEQLAKGDKDVW